MRTLGMAVGFLLVCGVASANTPAGSWRSLEDGSWYDISDEDGTLSTSVAVPKVGQVDLRGFAVHRQVILTGEAKGTSIGARGHIAGEAPADDDPRTVRLVGVRSQVDGQDRLEVTITAFGEEHHDVWQRSKAGLDLISVSPARFDPKRDDPLQVTVRVHGEEQQVSLAVDLPPQPPGFRGRYTLEATRLKFYGKKTIHRQQRVLPVGTHTLSWDGRDSDERRIALQGRYDLVLGSNKGDVVRGKVQIAQPRMALLSSPWPTTSHRRSTAPVHEEALEHFQNRLSGARASLGMYAKTKVELDWNRPEQFYEALRSSAVVHVTTHGKSEGLMIQDPSKFASWKRKRDKRRKRRKKRGKRKTSRPKTNWSCGARNGDCDKRCRLEHLKTRDITVKTLMAGMRLDASDGSKPLDDVLLVVIYACLVGQGRLDDALVELGVDSVVSFSTSIHDLQQKVFVSALIDEALEQPTLPGEQPNSMEEVAKEAAAAADAQYWTDARKREFPIQRAQHRGELKWFLEFKKPTSGSPRVGLFPARYGKPN